MTEILRVNQTRPLDLDPRLQRLFEPQSIAIVGASDNPTRVGGRILRFLRAGGYTGKVFPINPARDKVMGGPCWRSLADVPEPPDLTVMCVRADQTAQVLEDVALAGGSAAIAMAAGFREDGAAGAKLERELAEVVRRTGVRLLGPNSVGFRCTARDTFVTFASDVELGTMKGSVAVVSQSGGLAGYFGGAVLKSRGTGYRWIIDTGNELDIDIADCIAYLATDEEVSAIALITEGCGDGDRLRAALETARRAGKPVVALKLGGSKAGALSAASHTGALAGDDAIYDAVFREHGVYRVADEHELVDVLAMYDVGAVPRGRNVAIFSLSGGVATLLADACERRGLGIPYIDDPSNPAIAAALPSSRFNNPLDLSGQIGAEPQLLREVLHHVAGQEQVDSIILGFAYMLQSPVVARVFVDAIIEAADTFGKPMVVAGLATPEIEDELRAHGVLVQPMPVDAVNALAALAGELPRRVAAPRSGGGPDSVGSDSDVIPGMVTGTRAAALLPGLPFVTTHAVMDREEAIAVARSFSYPIVLKGESDQVTHKTELGLVRIGLRDDAEVGEAYDQVAASLAASGDGSVVVQPMVRGVEMILGVRNDPTFGPVVMVGSGGVFVEVLKDVAFGLPPLDRASAGRMVDSLRGLPLLEGARGAQIAAREDLLDALVALSEAALLHREVMQDVDVNPFIVTSTPGTSVAVDAVVTLSGTERSDPDDSEVGT
ncbi:acetate--CoA ligase family protein [Ornithinimicrobium faecis]|uniref:acetate--CoA ligase family protein n=1 Tax=Ornithinimicrobium faecis TaxID=2934158 RepID=UPI0021188E14|nr:acetate--CoA ligase family protein [Ornithinimicrobium sp. HY1745]